jgi:hypothetical protein
MPHVNFKPFPSTAINIRSNFDGRKNEILWANKLTHTSKKIGTHEVFFLATGDCFHDFCYV